MLNLRKFCNIKNLIEYNSMKFMIALSFDTDWAPQELIDDTINLLNDYNLKSTFFVTNKIDFSKIKNHEIAIHPNFQGTSNQEDILKETINFLPEKQTFGSRSHRLFFNSPLISLYEKFRIQYDSNFYMPGVDNIKPFIFNFADVVEIPFYFSDDDYIVNSKNFELNNLDLNNNGVKVFLFHPFHIFMNTKSSDFYHELKPHYKDYSFLKNRINQKAGIRNLFIDLLEYIENHDLSLSTLNEINIQTRESINV